MRSGGRRSSAPVGRSTRQVAAVSSLLEWLPHCLAGVTRLENDDRNQPRTRVCRCSGEGGMGRRVELTGDLVEEPGVSTLDLDDLTGDDGQRVEHAMAKFEAAMRDLTPDAWAEAGEANAEAYRQREPSMPSGFEKFLVMNVSESGAHIWEDHHD